MPNPFNKHYCSPHDLVDLLVTRGLTILDKAKAEDYLKHIGYYRLSAYMYPLLELPKNLHIFKKGSTFTRVMKHRATYDYGLRRAEESPQSECYFRPCTQQSDWVSKRLTRFFIFLCLMNYCLMYMVI